jgi:hypothetical protein
MNEAILILQTKPAGRAQRNTVIPCHIFVLRIAIRRTGKAEPAFAFYNRCRKVCPVLVFPSFGDGRGISRPGQIHRKAVTPPKWIERDAVIFRNRRNPRPSKQPPDIPYTLDPIDLPSRFDNHDE